MREVAIVGADELGGLCAHLIARREVASVVRLIDDTGRIASGKALDITQAASVEGFATRVAAATDLASGAGADVVVVADRVKSGEWAGDAAIELLRRLNASMPRAVFVMAGASTRDVVERGVRELRIDRSRLLGSAPEALAAAARALVALEADVSPRDVALAILGAPPAHIVVPWEDTTVCGLSAVRMLDEVARRRITARLAALWPPGPYALASAAALAVDGLAGHSRRVFSAFIRQDDSIGTKTRVVAVPVQASAAGVTARAPITLNVRDQVAFDNARSL